MSDKPKVCIVGGGMITQVQILPSIYHLQRAGVVGDISICALDSGPLRALAEDPMLKQAFPGQTFEAFPSLDTDPKKKFPESYAEVLSGMPKHQICVVAVPDQLHDMVLKAALKHDQHVCCVKPLVLKYEQAEEIAREAEAKGLVIGVEYHKRFDDRALMARRKYRSGAFGDFRLGHAILHECWYYRHSNFQNWCTRENSDTFAYIGCHYVDLVYFITGLRPTSVSVFGILDRYPNGKEGFLWTDARVLWENGACLNVQNSLGYPDDGPGGNIQGMRLHCQGQDIGAMIVHNDQFRGVEHCYVKNPGGPGDTIYAQPSPDYFQYVEQGGAGLKPVGYGYRSIEFIVTNIIQTMAATARMKPDAALAKRRAMIRRFDEEAIMATPRNSAYNELVMEAGRLSILNGAREVQIVYGNEPHVELRRY
jgi:predicted dehydrogenase